MIQNLKEIGPKNSLWVTSLSLLYIITMSFIIGFKTDQVVLALLFNVLYYISKPTRKFILGFLVFIVFWVIFDSMKAFPNYNVNKVHIEELYNTEKQLFGISENTETLTPNEFAQKHSNSFLDVLSGIFYINWVPVPLFLAFYFFRKNRPEFLNFSLAFLFVNILGFILYYLYPAAPPWYVKDYGFDIYFNTPGSAAGLARFDDYLGINLFHSLYAKSSNVFAAMPSLHSAYPVVVLYFGLKNKLGLTNILFAIFMMGVWFSAVYSGHHYVLDVIAGISCALTGILLYEKFISKTIWFRIFINNYNRLIS